MYNLYIIDFICTDTANFESTILSQTITGSDVIVLGFGGRILNSQSVVGGLQPSMSTFTNNLRLISRKNEKLKYWTFALPISWDVAILFGVIAFCVAILIWFFEERQFGKATKTQLWLNFLQMIYESFSSFFFTNALRLKTIGARFLIWTFCFIIILFLGIYYAHLVLKISSSFYEPELANFQFAIDNKKTIGIFSDY